MFPLRYRYGIYYVVVHHVLLQMLIVRVVTMPSLPSLSLDKFVCFSGSAVSMPIPSPATFETPVVDGQCPPSTKVNRVRDDILRGTVDKNANLG